MSSELTKLKAYAIAMGVLTAVVLTTLAIAVGFKDTNLVDNTTADKFIAAIAIFGTFSGVLVLSMMGKSIISIFQSK